MNNIGHKRSFSYILKVLFFIIKLHDFFSIYKKEKL